MRVVISGYYGYGNAGDEAILAGMLRLLRRARSDLEPTVLSGNPALTERDHQVAAVRRMSPSSTVSALRRADGLISGGGGLLQDRTSARPVSYYAGVTQVARLLGRPYVIYAQGLGPIRRRVNRLLARAALRAAAHRSLRDEASIAFARELGVDGPIDLVSDPALALEPPRGSGPRHLLIAVRSWPAAAPYLTSLRSTVRELAEEMPVVALPMHGEVDLAASRQVVEGIRGATVLSPTGGLDERLAAIGGSALVIGMRLHALILAAAAGIPALAISYDPKVDAFAARASQPVAGHVDQPIDPERVVAAARAELLRPPEPYRARVDEMRRTLQRSAAATLAAIDRVSR